MSLGDLLCFSHLRWHFVVQRPQHLMTRAAQTRRLFFIEEPVGTDGAPFMDEHTTPERVTVCTPHLPPLAPAEAEAATRRLVDDLVTRHQIEQPILWHYTPMMEPLSRGIDAAVTVYDCMDELSAFKFAPPELLDREALLMKRADLVFTGGISLYEAKRNKHPRVYAFPSSVDVAHFAQARQRQPEPADMAGIPHPRLGFVGVVDERMDLDLLRDVSALRPDWQFVIVGPVVKIDPATLPQAANIHYLGGKSYDELPAYLGSWDVALMPFARNESTRFISPTKTPEYLAAGLPVVSTPILDVVRTYGSRKLVEIAETPTEFVAACERALSQNGPERWATVDAFLSTISWDATWGEMERLIQQVRSRSGGPRIPAAIPSIPPSVPPQTPPVITQSTIAAGSIR